MPPTVVVIVAPTPEAKACFTAGASTRGSRTRPGYPPAVRAHSTAAPRAAGKPVTLRSLREMHARGEKIAMLTAYDAAFARLVDDAGVDTVLVGDSLGMLLQGHASTLPVTLDEMAYHTRCTARGLTGGAAWLVTDMPVGLSPIHICSRRPAV